MQLRTEVVLRVEGSSGMEGSSGQRNVTSKRLDVAEASGLNSKNCEFLEEALGNMDMCEGQILVTTRMNSMMEKNLIGPLR